MDFTTVVVLVLIVGLAAAMTADFILDCQNIWECSGRGSGRIDVVQKEDAPERPRVADISWVQIVEANQPEIEVDVIQLAKSRQKSKPVVQAGVKVRQLLDGLGKSAQQLVDYSSMTIRELKAIAKQRRLPKYGSMRKAELIAALQS